MSGNRPASIVLVVDNPFRDLPGLVLVALELCARGHEVRLVPLTLQRNEVPLIPADGVLLNHVRRGNAKLVRDYLARGVIVAVLDTEGGIIESWDAYARLMPLDPTIVRGVDAWCMWGPRIAGYATDSGTLARDRVHVTGCPRMDFYAPRLRAAALDLNASTTHCKGPMILVNSNVPLANPAFRSAEKEAKMFVDIYKYKPERVNEWQARQTVVMHGLAEITNRLAADLPDIQFVFRPHPFENIHQYQGLLHKRPNITLTKEGTVDGWLLRARAIVQRSCSTAVEASMIGISALSPTFLPTPCSAPVADLMSSSCASYEELRDNVARACGETVPPSPVLTEEQSAVIHDWFNVIDGLAHKRVADQIEKQLAMRTDRMPGHIPGRWRALARRWIGHSGRARRKWETSEKYYSIELVRRMTASLTSCSDLFPTLAARGVAVESQHGHKSVFLLKRE